MVTNLNLVSNFIGHPPIKIDQPVLMGRNKKCYLQKNFLLQILLLNQLTKLEIPSLPNLFCKLLMKIQVMFRCLYCLFYFLFFDQSQINTGNLFPYLQNRSWVNHRRSPSPLSLFLLPTIVTRKRCFRGTILSRPTKVKVPPLKLSLSLHTIIFSFPQRS